MLRHISIAADSFREFGTDVFKAIGISADDALDAVETLVWASLRGVDTHGIRNFKSYYVDPVSEKRIKASPKFRIEHESAVSVRADGDGGLGLVAGCWGMRLAIEKATASGIGLVSMRNSNHLGAAGFFSSLAVKHDMVGLCMSGHLYAEGHETGVPPVFSLQPMFGTNPLSVAVPCGQAPTYVLDMSTSIVPVNRVEMMQAAGQTLPLGWCLDAAGNPTTDPSSAKVYLPLGGTRELGAHKGYGLAMFVEILTALFSAGWSEQSNQALDVVSSGATPVQAPAEVASGPARYAQDKIAHCFGAIRLDLFREPSAFKDGMDAMVDALHQAPTAPGHDRVYVPGEIEHEVQRRRSQSGIPLGDREVHELRELSVRYDVRLDLTQ